MVRRGVSWPWTHSGDDGAKVKREIHRVLFIWQQIVNTIAGQGNQEGREAAHKAPWDLSWAVEADGYWVLCCNPNYWNHYWMYADNAVGLLSVTEAQQSEVLWTSTPHKFQPNSISFPFYPEVTKASTKKEGFISPWASPHTESHSDTRVSHHPPGV